MHKNALALAVVALLALSANGAVAASMTTPTADTASAVALPANHTVDVVNPDKVADTEVDRAIDIVWANDSTQSYFDDGAAIHFEVWASVLDEEIVHVKVAPQDAPDDTRVVADVDLDEQTVTEITEPVTLNATNTVSLNATEYDVVSADGDELEVNNDTGDSNETSDENGVKINADQLSEDHLNMSSTESDCNGVFTVEIE